MTKNAKTADVQNVANVQLTTEQMKMTAKQFAQSLSGKQHTEIIGVVCEKIKAVSNKTTAKIDVTNCTIGKYSDADKKITGSSYTFNLSDIDTGSYDCDGTKIYILAVKNVIEKSGRKRATRYYITDKQGENVVYADSITSFTKRVKTIVKNAK